MNRALRIPDKIYHLTRQSMINRGKVANFFLALLFVLRLINVFNFILCIYHLLCYVTAVRMSFLRLR